jgi:hypothetical protein
MTKDNYIEIETFDFETKETSFTIFKEREDFAEFLRGLFKEPGFYEFDESIEAFTEPAEHFNTYNVYTYIPKNTKDYYEYWDKHKKRNIDGYIIKNKGKVWYITPDYYFFINYCRILNKEINKPSFVTHRDVIYHLALYEWRAMIESKNAAVTKKRQMASSYFHCAAMLRVYWFLEGLTIKIAAHREDYINHKGIWAYLQSYFNFLNKNTAWTRHNNPDKVLHWDQNIEGIQNNKKIKIGNFTKILGYTTNKDPLTPVGGPCYYFYNEEAGVAPTLDRTAEGMLPAMMAGEFMVGLMVFAGSVGELDQCEPLKQYMYNPDAMHILPVKNRFIDDKGNIGETGLFIPEQWGMIPHVDNYGNSLVDEALQSILETRKKWKKDLAPETYRFRCSQHPINLKETFDLRSESKFPVSLLNSQKERINNKEYFLEYVDLERSSDGKLTPVKAVHPPVLKFPVDVKDPNKQSCIVIHERPIDNPPFGLYYASKDPVAVGKTNTSKSLASIYVYKNDQEVITYKEDGSRTVEIVPGKLVAWYTGRYDDVNKTNKIAEELIEYYNAWTLVENNVTQFVQHMIGMRKQKYLVPKDQIQFLKEISSNTNVFQEYGWRNVGKIFTDNLIPYTLQFISEELNSEMDAQGNVTNVTFGIERIPDIMLIEEMSQYREGMNVDRLIAFAALCAFIRLQKNNKGFFKTYKKDESLENQNKMPKLRYSGFNTVGRKAPRGFKNIR